jgi:16S rRNA (guanine966-N2)-methyltransferase
LFSLVGQDLTDCDVLDAFGGSGLLGLEAWSRGARVCIVERDRRAFRSIQANASGLGAEVDILHGDLHVMVHRLEPADVVFADPPYALAPEPVVALLAPLVKGQLVLETDKDASVPADVAGLVLTKSRNYGGTRLCVFARG